MLEVNRLNFGSPIHQILTIVAIRGQYSIRLCYDMLWQAPLQLEISRILTNNTIQGVSAHKMGMRPHNAKFKSVHLSQR